MASQNAFGMSEWEFNDKKMENKVFRECKKESRTNALQKILTELSMCFVNAGTKSMIY